MTDILTRIGDGIAYPFKKIATAWRNWRSRRSAAKPAVAAKTPDYNEIVAKHTRIQSATNVITALFGVMTTSFLLYLSYMQYQLTEQQSELQEAILEPQFSAKMGYISSGRFDSDTPATLAITTGIGNANIENISAVVYGTIGVRRDKKYSSCDIGITNFFSGAEDGSNLYRARPIVTSNVIDLQTDRKESVSFYYLFTLLKITYRNGLGKQETVTFVDRYEHDSLSPFMTLVEQSEAMEIGLDLREEAKKYELMRVIKDSDSQTGVRFDFLKPDEITKCKEPDSALDAMTFPPPTEEIPPLNR